MLSGPSKSSKGSHFRDRLVQSHGAILGEWMVELVDVALGLKPLRSEFKIGQRDPIRFQGYGGLRLNPKLR